MSTLVCSSSSLPVVLVSIHEVSGRCLHRGDVEQADAGRTGSSGAVSCRVSWWGRVRLLLDLLLLLTGVKPGTTPTPTTTTTTTPVLVQRAPRCPPHEQCSNYDH